MNEAGLFTIGLFCVGLLAGFVVIKIVECLPGFLTREWSRDATEYLGLPPVTSVSPARSVDSDHGSARRIGTVLFTGLVSGWVAWHYGVAPTTGAALILAWGLLIVSLIDLDHLVLPDLLVLPLLWLGLIVNSIGLFTSAPNAVWGAVAGYLVMWTLRSLSRLISGQHGIGQGDLKLLAMLGAWGGWQILPTTLLVSSLIGAAVGAAFWVSGKTNRHTPIPFGPYLASAGWLSLLYMQGWVSI